MDKETQIFKIIQQNPFISQQEIADQLKLSRSAVAGYISSLTKSGRIKGRAYILPVKKGIVAIGGAHLDRKATCNEEIQYETSNPVTISEMCGGVVRNISENLGKLSCDVSLISCVGHDKEGEWVLQNTSKHGIDTSQVKRDSTHHTGTYTALLNPSGELAVAMANMKIYDQITVPFIMERWSHIAQSSMVILDTNLPEKTLFYIVERCKLEGIPVTVDPVSTVKARKLFKSLNGIHSLLPNKDEAEVLSGITINNIDDCQKAGQIILELGVKQVVITLGSEGVYAASEEESFHLPAYPVETVDVTGAGDAFAGGYLYALLNEEPFFKACQYGQALAALTLKTSMSVYPYLTPETILKQMEEYECINI